MEWTIETTPERLWKLLRAIHRTQRQLAKILGVHPVTLNKWCKGKAVPAVKSQELLELLESRFKTLGGGKDE